MKTRSPLFSALTIAIGMLCSCTDGSRRLLEMVKVPAGQFLMGDYSRSDTRPAHNVRISGAFWIGKYEMTNAQYCKIVNYLVRTGELTVDDKSIRSAKTKLIVMVLIDVPPFYRQFGIRADPPFVSPVPGKEDHPVIGPTWYAALHVCNGLSLMEGLTPAYDIPNETWNPKSHGYRLPTEAEWEYAARGTKSNPFPWGSGIGPEIANYFESGDPFEGERPDPAKNGGPTTPVGYFNGETHSGFQTKSNASPFGAFDMAGNVSEWCWDTYQSDYYNGTPKVDPAGPGRGVPKTARGGHWQNRPEDLAAFVRQNHAAGSWPAAVGIRVARTAR
jgi:formylglycine-generating enzyme required for sulfatase activity